MLVTQTDSGVSWPAVGGKKEEGEGEEEKKQQLISRLSDGRAINTLPLHSPHNYTPYFNLEFDIAVQDYCRNQLNKTNLLNKQTEWLDSAGGGGGGGGASCKFIARQVKNSLQKRSSLSSSKLFNSSQTTHAGQDSLSQKTVRNCKVVVSGDVAVGKTCLVNRFGHSVYSSNYQTTIGVDFDLQRFNILGQSYVLQVSSSGHVGNYHY